MDRRLARNPVLRSPALRSPVLSPKSPAIYEKYKSGCAWGLIHFFDFRQGHSHGKLISYKKRSKRQAKGKNSEFLVCVWLRMKYNASTISFNYTDF